MSYSLYEEFESQSAIDAYKVIEEAFQCLPLFSELLEQRSLKELVLLNAYVVSYQSALCTFVIKDRLDDMIERIDCAGTKTPDFWMTSQLAAIDKAKEIGLIIPPEWSLDDLRYKLHQEIYGGLNG